MLDEKIGRGSVCPHLYTLSLIQVFAHTCTHGYTYRCLLTPVHSVTRTGVCPHLTHCHTYRCLPTPVSTVTRTGVCSHLTHCHTYRCLSTLVHIVTHTGVFPQMYTLSHIQGFAHTCTHCHIYRGLPTYIYIDRFYIALFSALEQTHCARM